MTNAEMIKVIDILVGAITKNPELANDASIYAKMYAKTGDINCAKGIDDRAGIDVQMAITMLRNDIFKSERDAAAKAKGDTKRLKTALKWQKETQKLLPSKTIYGYPDYQGDYQVFCDGYKAVMLVENDRLAFVEKPQEYREENTYINMEKTFPATHSKKEMEMPDVVKLNTALKSNKDAFIQDKGRKNKLYYDFGGYQVDANYLAVLMNIMPSDTKYYRSDESKSLSCMVGISESGSKCILQPVRPVGESNESTKTVL